MFRRVVKLPVFADVEEHVEEPIEEEKVEEIEEEEAIVEEKVEEVEEETVEKVEEPQKVEDEFNQIDTNGDGVISREEFEAHKVEQKEELESRLAAAVASADYQLAGEIQKSIANLG